MSISISRARVCPFTVSLLAHDAHNTHSLTMLCQSIDRSRLCVCEYYVAPLCLCLRMCLCMSVCV